MTSRYLQLCIDRWISVISFVTTFISYWRNTCTYEAGKNPVFPLLLPYKNKEKKNTTLVLNSKVLIKAASPFSIR